MRTEFFKNPTPAPSTAAPWSKRQTATIKASTIVFGGFFITDNGERIQIPILENPNIKEINNFFSVSNFEKKAGVLVFRIIPEPEFGNNELTETFAKFPKIP